MRSFLYKKQEAAMSILSFEEPYTDNEVVGYYEDKLIVKREDGELFFCEIPENLIEIGETISPKDLTLKIIRRI